MAGTSLGKVFTYIKLLLVHWVHFIGVRARDGEDVNINSVCLHEVVSCLLEVSHWCKG